MVDKFSGTLLPQSSDKLENQKAILDLLAKVNKLNADLGDLVQTNGIVLNHTTNTSPVDGEIWYDLDQNSLVQYVDGARLYGSSVLFSGVGTTIGNTTSELSQIGAGYGTTTIPADFLAPGKVIRIKTRGRITTAATGPSATFRIYLDGLTLITSTATQGANLNGFYVESEIDIRVISIGSAGTIWLSGRALTQTATGLAAPLLRGFSVSSATTVNTRIPLKIDLTYAWGTASTSNSLTIDEVMIEILA